MAEVDKRQQILLPRAGDRDGVAARVQAERARLFRIAVGVCGDPHLAEEAVADAIARSWPRLRSGRVEDPRSYLRRAVLNSLNGRFRRSGLERRTRARRHADDRGNHDQIAGVGDRAEVVQLLEGLSERQRAVIVLRFYEDMTNEQIADALGVPIGTVKSTMSRALANLRDRAEGRGDV